MTQPLDEQLATEQIIERIIARGIATIGRCSCRHPQPFQYLSTRVEKGRHEDVYRCDSCSKHIYIPRETKQAVGNK